MYTASACARPLTLLALLAGAALAQVPQAPQASQTPRALHAPDAPDASRADAKHEAQAPPRPAQAPAHRLLPLEVTLNGAGVGTWLFLERSGQLYAPQDALIEWRVELPAAARTVEFRGESYVPMSALPGFRSRIDMPTQSLELRFSPEAFAATQLRAQPAQRETAAAVLPAVFFNYDINLSANRYRDAAPLQDLGLVTETGVSTALGVLTMSHAGRNLGNDRTLGQGREWTRLETTFTRDFPERRLTLRLGDSATRAGLSGHNLYFGGIQLGTNDALRPGFVRQPLPRLRGVSTAPSTVDLYVNDVLRQSSSVPTGPFTIDNFPMLNGSGEARLVVRDVLGRETVIVQPFLTSPQLLAPGLHDWSVEAGRLRSGLGSGSDRYGDHFGSFVATRGMRDDVTLQAHGEAARGRGNVGLGVVAALPWQWLGRADGSISHANAPGTGRAWLLGAEQAGLRHLLSFEMRGASRNFRPLQIEPMALPQRAQAAAHWNYTLDGGTSLGLGYARIAAYDAPSVSTLSFNLGFRVGAQGYLSFVASHVMNAGTRPTAGLNFTLPLGQQRVASASLARRAAHIDAHVSVQQNPGPESELGWRVLVGRQDGGERAEAGAYLQGRHGIATADISSANTYTAVRAGAKGALVWADGRVFTSRRIDDSFAVAEVAGYPDVGIGLAGNVLARTNADGVALVPRLMPYQANAVRLDPRELPLSAELDVIELSVVPAWRSAVKLVFPVRSGRGALVRVVLDDGEPAPAGSQVHIVSEENMFYVGRRGEAFVTGLKANNRLQLVHNGQRCSFDALLPETTGDDEVLRIGPLACRGIIR